MDFTMDNMTVNTFNQTAIDRPVSSNDSLSFDQILEIKKEKIRGLSAEIRKLQDKFAQKNTMNKEKTVLMPDPSPMAIYKRNILNKLIAVIKDSSPSNFSSHRAQITAEIVEELISENATCKNAVDMLNQRAVGTEQEINRLTEIVTIFEEITNAPVKKESLIEEKNKNALKLIKKDIQECSNDLKMVLNSVFPESDMFETIAELLKKSIEDENNWYDVKNTSAMAALYLLIESNLVIINPNNEQQVRLANMN